MWMSNLRRNPNVLRSKNSFWTSVELKKFPNDPEPAPKTEEPDRGQSQLKLQTGRREFFDLRRCARKGGPKRENKCAQLWSEVWTPSFSTYVEIGGTPLVHSFSNYVYCHFFNFFNTAFCDLRSSGSDVLDGPFFSKSGKCLLSLQADFFEKQINGKSLYNFWRGRFRKCSGTESNGWENEFFDLRARWRTSLLLNSWYADCSSTYIIIYNYT